MATQTKTKPQARVDEPQARNEVAIFSPPRLPYHEAIQERFEVDRGGWKVLVEAIFPAAKTVDSVVMALSYCRQRNLDIFKRPVHIVPMWSTALNRMVETVWPSISELRTTAFRTKQYAGKDATVFGPLKKKKFTGTLEGRNGYKDRNIDVIVAFPEWAQITLYRTVNNERQAFVSPKVYWLESYGRMGKTDVPNEMWQKRSNGQFEKCVEAAALRVAFPEEIGNDYAAEEMEGQIIHSDLPAIKPPAPTIAPEQEPEEQAEPQQEKRTPPKPPAPTVIEGDYTEVEQKEPEPKSMPELLAWIDTKLKAVTPDILEAHPDVIDEIWNDEIAPRLEGKFPPDVETAQGIRRQHEKRLGA